MYIEYICVEICAFSAVPYGVLNKICIFDVREGFVKLCYIAKIGADDD